MEIAVEELQTRIDFLKSAVSIEPIMKGYSMEQKYLVTTDLQHHYLLRVMPADSFPRKQVEFDIIGHMYSDHVKVPEPIEIGRLDDLSACYYVLTYVDGSDAQDLLPTYSDAVQYQIGVEAGETCAGCMYSQHRKRSVRGTTDVF